MLKKGNYVYKWRFDHTLTAPRTLFFEYMLRLVKEGLRPGRNFDVVVQREGKISRIRCD